MRNLSLFNPQQVRQDFPILQQPLIYLDSAATAQKPNVVIDSIAQFYRGEYGTVHRALYRLSADATARYHAIRLQAAQFLGSASPEEIIFTKGTTDAINLVAASFGRTFLEEGDEVIISEMEHHSNIVPWQLICRERKAHLKFIPINDQGELICEAFEKLLTPRTKLVSIAHIANSTGTINPLEWIISQAHAVGAKVFVDGAQSAPHLPVNVTELDADFYAFSGHKAYGPTGIGILYGKRELLEAMVPYQSGSDMIQEVFPHETTFGEIPLKFEAGTPAIAEVIGLGAALNYIETIDRSQIALWEEELRCYCTKKLLEIPHLRLIGNAAKKGAIITFTIEGLHPLDIGTLLDLRGIAVRTGHLCAQPTLRHFGVTSAVRVSFGLYNTLEEIDTFVSALQEVIKSLG